MRASQEARWRKNVKETAARRRRIEKLAEEQRGKEELQRKEALERRKFERDLSDRFLRKPAAKPPEPIKPILRKGAGAQRYGAGTNSRKPLSPRSNVRQMQARLREHVRQQRERIKQQHKSGQHPNQEHAVLEESGPRWAQLVDSQEVDTAGDTGVETFSFPPAVARDCVNYADESQCMAAQQAEEGSNRLGKPCRPISMVLHLLPSYSLNSILNQLSPPTQQLLQTSREEVAISARRRIPTMRKAKFGTFMLRRAKHLMRLTSGWMGCGSARGAMPPPMEATRKRADKEAHERARLAAELSKRRAQVSAREAKENKAKTKAEMRSAPRRPGSCVPKKAAPPMVQHSLAQQHAPVVAANIYAAPAPVPYPAGQPVAKPARKGVVNQALDASFEVSDCGDSDDGQELPDDWEAQIAAPRPSVPKHMQRAPGPRPASSNFARSPLAAALMQLVGLPGMHAPNAMPMAPPSAGPTPGMLGPAMADAALERLTAEEDALLKSLSRLDPKMLRKSLKSAGMDLWSHEGYLQLSNSAEQGKLLKSLARLDMQLQALRAHQGVHARFMAIRSKYHECHLPLPRLCPGANSSQFMAITATLQLVLRSREHAGTCLRQQLITRLATLATKCLECKGQDGLGLATTTLRLLQAGTVLPLVNHQAAPLVVPHLGCR
eukprot:jgi/Tetstr1/430131/TSEL_019964.t1